MLVVSNVLGGVAVASGFAVAGLLAENISGSTSMAGLVATSTTLGAAILAVPLARLARSRGRRISLTTGYLIATAGALLSIVAAQIDSLLLLLLAGCLFGSGSAANLQSRYAATDAADPEYVARSLSVVVWATTIGVVVGPNLTGVGGSLGTSVGLLALAGPYLFSVVAFALALATVWFGLRRLQQVTVRTKVERQPLATTFRQVMAIPHARLGLLAIATAHAVMVGVMSMTSVHLRHHGASLTIVGFVISGHVAGMYALSPVMGWLADRLGRIPTIGIGLAILACAMTVAALAPDDAHGLTGTGPVPPRPRLVRLPGRRLHPAVPLGPGRHPHLGAGPVRPHHGRPGLDRRYRRRPGPRRPRLPLARRPLRPPPHPRRPTGPGDHHSPG